MDKKKKLSEVLRSKRRSMKITQEQAAELLDISVKWYQMVERGEAKPGFSLVCELAYNFGVDFAEFSEKNKKTV